MATEQEKQELIDTLKFTPVTYTIQLWGYGGEIAVAKINKEQYEYWKPRIEDGDSELVEHATSWLDEEEENPVPKSARIVNDGAWYETEGHLDNMSGCEFAEQCHIQIDDENGNTVFDHPLAYEVLEDLGVQLDSNEVMAGDVDGVEYAFCFQSIEKGTFFAGDIELKAPFDPKKLKITYTDFEGWELVSGVEYNGEWIDGLDGYDTTGKGSYANVYEV